MRQLTASIRLTHTGFDTLARQVKDISSSLNLLANSVNRINGGGRSGGGGLRIIAQGMREVAEKAKSAKQSAQVFIDHFERTTKSAEKSAAVIVAGFKRREAAARDLIAIDKQLAASNQRADAAAKRFASGLNSLVGAFNKERTAQLASAVAANHWSAIKKRQEMELTRLRRRLIDYRATLDQINQTLRGIQITAGLAFGALIGGMGMLAKKAIETRSAFQQYQGLMTAMLGGGQQMGERAFGALKEFALKSPLTLRETVEAANRLLQFGHQFGDIIRKDTGLLQNLTKAAVASGVPLEQVVEALEDVREGNFLQRRLTPLGVTSSRMKQWGLELDEKGRPLAADTNPELVYQTIVKGIQDLFKDFDIENLLSVKLSNIQDALDIFFNGVGQSFETTFQPLLVKIADVIRKAISFIETPAFKAAADKLQKEVLIPLGETLIDFFDKAISYLEQNPTALVDAFNMIIAAVKTLATVIVTTQIIIMMGSLMQAIASVWLIMSNPGGWAVVSLLVLAGAFAFSKMQSVVDKFLPTIKDTDAVISTMGKDSAPAAVDAFGEMNKAITTLNDGPLGDMLRLLGGIVDLLKDIEQSKFGQWAGSVGDAMMQWQFGIPARAGSAGLDWLRGKVAPDSAQVTGISSPKIGGASRGEYVYNPATGGWEIVDVSSLPTYGPQMPSSSDYPWPEGTPIDPNAPPPVDREGIISTALSFVSGKSDVIRAIAASVTGRTDKLCAAALEQYYRAMGFNPPHMNTTDEVEAWALSIGAQRVSAADLRPGDIMMSAATGPLGMRAHTGLVVEGMENGVATYLDQYGEQTRGLKYFSHGLRLPTEAYSSALGGYMGPQAQLRTLDDIMGELNAGLAKEAALRAELGEQVYNELHGMADTFEEGANVFQQIIDRFKLIADTASTVVNNIAGAARDFMREQAEIARMRFNRGGTEADIEAMIQEGGGNFMGAMATRGNRLAVEMADAEARLAAAQAAGDQKGVEEILDQILQIKRNMVDFILQLVEAEAMSAASQASARFGISVPGVAAWTGGGISAAGRRGGGKGGGGRLSDVSGRVRPVQRSQSRGAFA